MAKKTAAEPAAAAATGPDPEIEAEAEKRYPKDLEHTSSKRAAFIEGAAWQAGRL